MKEEDKKKVDLGDKKESVKIIREDEILDDKAKEAVDGGKEVEQDKTDVPGECNFCSPIL